MRAVSASPRPAESCAAARRACASCRASPTGRHPTPAAALPHCPLAAARCLPCERSRSPGPPTGPLPPWAPHSGTLAHIQRVPSFPRGSSLHQHHGGGRQAGGGRGGGPGCPVGRWVLGLRKGGPLAKQGTLPAGRPASRHACHHPLQHIPLGPLPQTSRHGRQRRSRRPSQSPRARRKTATLRARMTTGGCITRDPVPAGNEAQRAGQLRPLPMAAWHACRDVPKSKSMPPCPPPACAARTARRREPRRRPPGCGTLARTRRRAASQRRGRRLRARPGACCPRRRQPLQLWTAPPLFLTRRWDDGRQPA